MEVLAQYKNMKDYMFQDQRLETFSEWPFNENSSCNAHKMAEAGFIFCGSKSEPDLTQCQVCLKKLDGWERDDDPWKEHKKHSPSCLYVKIGKKEADMTVGNHFDLPLERRRNIMVIEGKYQHYSMGFHCQVSSDWCLSLFSGCPGSDHPFDMGKKEEYETYRASFIEMAAEVRKKIIKLRKLKK